MSTQIKNSKNYAIKIMVISLCLFSTIVSFGQGRSYIKQAIREWGECRNVAITKTNGDLALYGANGCARSGLPNSLNEAITELNKDNDYIDDIQLTENGAWLILYGNNGFRWNDLPYSLEQKLRQFNRDKEIVLSVTFNDAGDWIIISKDYFNSSDSRINDWLKEGNEEFGKLWAACITDDALVAVFAGFDTLTLPEVPAPTTAVIVVGLPADQEVAAVPPKLTAVAPVRFVPVIVTVAPFPALVAVNEVMVGA